MTPEETHAQQVWDEADCLFDRQAVSDALDRMATEMRPELAGHNPLLLCVMNGALMTCSELLLRMDYPVEVNYIHATRYRGETMGSELHWLHEPEVSLEGRVVLVVDDILDEGPTLKAIMQYCRDKGAGRALSAVLVDKKHDHRAHGAKADFVGMEAPDRYLFGFGMDYKEYLRNAPGIYAVKGM